MLRRAQYAYSYGKSSVCPSVMLKYRGHIGWNTLKIISWLLLVIEKFTKSICAYGIIHDRTIVGLTTEHQCEITNTVSNMYIIPITLMTYSNNLRGTS